MDQPIIFEDVNYVYSAGTPFAFTALKDVSCMIQPNRITAIIGHTGSGKSTFIQHLNALLRPQTGTVKILGEELTAQSKRHSLKQLRQQVGIVFQFPESQLFEETVLKDVMFGPLNFGKSEAEAEMIAKEKLELVGIKKELYERSPFDLSGGQMRRVAIAGVLAQEPQILVLDEPTAGLDPMGHQQMMDLFVKLHHEQQITIVMVTHQMDDVAQYADDAIVFEQGQIVKQGLVEEIFADSDWLASKQLNIPHPVQFMHRLELELGYPLLNQSETVLTADQVAERLIQVYNQRSITKGESSDV